MTESSLKERMAPRQYNYCLDYFKGLACVFVVFMHCEFPGYFGTIVQAISRFCVPFFFMVSGFFCYNAERSLSRPDFKRKINHIGRIVIWSSLFYLVWLLIQLSLFGGKSVAVTIPNIAAFLLLNLPIGISSHLWFLFALLYVYVFQHKSPRMVTDLSSASSTLRELKGVKGSYRFAWELKDDTSFPCFCFGVELWSERTIVL